MVNIKVAVRIRPLSQRESIQNDKIVVRKENKSVVVTNPKIPERQDGDSRQRTRRFSVDFCYDAEDPEGSGQESVYKEIGSEVLDSMFEGYNACVLAYGHSASGKTYTIMGLEDDPGLTPRICEGLFRRVEEKPSRVEGNLRVEVAASFLEIYNEKVRDLLGGEDPAANSNSFSLRVREHPKLGPYVQGLSEHLVTDERALLNLLASGNGKRSTAATENNTHSSRSHAVFTIHFRQSDGEKCETEKWSKVHLVDLAGSLPEVPQQENPNERATTAQSKARLQEGANINKSLVTLGNVISALAESLESGVPKEHAKNWHPFVPYRDSVLTWLLKDTLGGNSNTIMIATISPASGCLSETVNTLRYAKRTKRIVNEAIVNEDPKVRTIRELRKEVERLKGLLVSFQSVSREVSAEEVGWSEEGMKRSGGGEGGGCEGLDEKESVVNGSANDTFSHESQIFSDSLESLGSVGVRRGVSCEGGGEFGENLRKDTPGMLHRSRPDLIKGISGRFKERLPSTSSQSCTDLSLSTSENSLNSSGSVEVQSTENKNAPTAKGEAQEERRVAVRKDKRSEIVEAVTSRLYVAQKKPEQKVKAVAEADESKLCKRARMKLFDLSRKLAMRRTVKRTVDSDTQTDSVTGTIRMKEKSVEADFEDLSLGSNSGRLTMSKISGTAENQNRFRVRQEFGTQTATEEKFDRSANTSPTELSHRDDESFSDDSLDGEKQKNEENPQIKPPTAMKYLKNLEDKKNEEPLFNGLPFSVLTDAEIHAVVHPSNSGLASKKDENMSSDSSFTSAEGTEFVSSSDASSEDFVFFENPKEKDAGVTVAVARDRELYTITENSEQSDPSEAFSPIQSQNYSFEGDAGQKWLEGTTDGRLDGRKEPGGADDSKQRSFNPDVPNNSGCKSEDAPERKSCGSEAGTAKLNLSDGHSSSEKQYLNLNISNNSKAPFSIDTHLFGKEWKKEQSADGMFTSADSLTLVFMGPAKPKSSVLMEIIRRSLGRDSLSSSPSHKKSKSRGVQCDVNLVRSVSVDTAMIALSRIARNSEESPQIARTTSLGALDPVEAPTTASQEKVAGQKETSCQCDLDSNTQKKKSALKCSVGTDAMFCEHFENDVTRQKKQENGDRPKKSVSWLGETKYELSEGALDPETQKPTQTDRLLQPVTPPVVHSSDDLTAFLKEAIQLLRKINSTPSRLDVPDDLGKDLEVERRNLEEHEKGSLKRTRKVELQTRSGAESWLENGRLKVGGRGLGAGEGEGDENWATSTWPRRRGTTGKPPTGMRGRLGRSTAGGRWESLHSSGFMESSRSVRSCSSGNSWTYLKHPLGCSGASCCSDESDRRQRVYNSDEDRDFYERGRDSDFLMEAEADLENCCRRLELAVEQDEIREKNSKKALLDERETGIWTDSEENPRKRTTAREGIKRRKAECTGSCTCRPSAKDPCKRLFAKGCQSSFELDSFGPGSKHCHQFCIFCRKKDSETYSSALNLNSECLSGVCRLDYYGYCPCSSSRLSHVTSSPRAYMQHLLTLRRQIVSRSTPESRSFREGCRNPLHCHSLS